MGAFFEVPLSLSSGGHVEPLPCLDLIQAYELFLEVALAFGRLE